MSSRYWFRLAMISTLSLGLTACGPNANDNGGNPQAQQFGMNRNGDARGLQGLRFNRDDLNWQQGNGMSIRGNNIVPNDRGDNRGNNVTHNNDRMDVSQELAERISALRDVQTANVLLTNENAYIAVVLDDNVRSGGKRGNQRAAGAGDRNGASDEVADQVKSKITDQVRKFVPTVRNVYVSANPDFVDRVNNIAEDASKGRAIQGFMEEFNSMVRRIFPAQNP